MVTVPTFFAAASASTGMAGTNEPNAITKPFIYYFSQMMKNTIWLFMIGLLLYGCTTISEKRGDTIVTKADTVKTVQTFDEDSLIDLQNFEISTNYTILDETIAALNENKNTQVFISKPCGYGDCEFVYKRLNSADGKTMVYLFKGDCGEYGFSNDQFLFSNNRLTVVRNFNYSIEQFADDSLPTLFKIEEEIIDFTGDKALVKHRKKITSSLYVYTMPDIEFKTTHQSKDSLMPAQLKFFKDNIEREKYRDE